MEQPHEEGIGEQFINDFKGTFKTFLRYGQYAGNPVQFGMHTAIGAAVDPEEARDAEGWQRTMALGVSAMVPGIGAGLAGVVGREALSGAAYGALRPKEEDESFLKAVVGDAAFFSLFGAGLFGLGQAGKKILQRTAPKLFERIFKGQPELEKAAREVGDGIELDKAASPEVKELVDLAQVGYTTEFTDEYVLMQAMGMTDEFLGMPKVTPLSRVEVPPRPIYQPIIDKLKFVGRKRGIGTSGRVEPLKLEEPIETATGVVGVELRQAGEKAIETAGVRPPLDPRTVTPSPVEGAVSNIMSDVAVPPKPGMAAGTVSELFPQKPTAALEPHTLQRKVLADIERVLKGKKPKEPTINTAIKAIDNTTDQATRNLDDAFNTLGDQAENLVQILRRNPEAGYSTMRVLAGLSGGGLMAGGATAEDPAKSNLMWAGGLALVAAASLPSIKQFALSKNFGRAIRNTFHPTSALEGGAKVASEEWQRTRAYSRAYALMLRDHIKKHFPSQQSRELLAYALDGEAVEFGMLTPAQQLIATELRNFNKALGVSLEATGSIEHMVENYYTRIWPKDAMPQVRRLIQSTKGVASKRGKFSIPRELQTFKQAEAWSAKMGIPGPRKDAEHVFAIHVEEAFNAIGNARLVNALERLGLVASEPADATWVNLTASLRGGLVTNKFAHPDVEPVLKAFFTPGAGRNAYDKMTSLMLRSIMFWFWEHGINVFRAGLAAGTSPMSWVRYGRAIANSDPLLLQAAKDGFVYGARSDLGRMAEKAFESNLERLGPNAPLVKKFVGKIGEKLEHEQRLLWERIVPSIGLATYAKEMRKFGNRNPHATEEALRAAGQAAARHANDVMGMVPKGMASEMTNTWMRRFFFAPAWLRTRMNIQFNAWGEAGDVIAGKLDIRDAFYLQYKIRQALLAVGITSAISYALTGKPPAFNERTGKFYARTGLKDKNTGREMGLDLVAWFQDDLRLPNDPIEFLGHKANPVIKAATESLLEGRDYAGRPLEGGERIENLIRAMGPVGAGISLPFQAAQGNVEGAETYRTAGRLLGISGVASLPTPADQAFGAIAKRLLRNFGVSDNEDNVYEISRLLKGNALSGQPIVDRGVLVRIASMQRSDGKRLPITKTIRDGLDKLR